MKGSIRMVAGFFLTLGAVGTIDLDPTAPLITQFALAVAGLAIMYTGVNAMKES